MGKYKIGYLLEQLVYVMHTIAYQHPLIKRSLRFYLPLNKNTLKENLTNLKNGRQDGQRLQNIN
jgi:hypothetical protein